MAVYYGPQVVLSCLFSEPLSEEVRGSGVTVTGALPGADDDVSSARVSGMGQEPANLPPPPPTIRPKDGSREIGWRGCPRRPAEPS